jgi:FkbM family methyltransferase
MQDQVTAVSSKGKLSAAGGERRLSLLRQGASALRSRLAAIVRYHLARHGLLLLNARSRLGLDYMRDIEWLAQSWGHAVETFFDVGANVGDTALAAFQRFPGVHVCSFEPHPSTFAKLQQRIGTGYRFSGENLALGLAVGNVDMFEYDMSLLNSLAPDAPFAVRFGLEGRRMQVCCTTLSAYCREKGIDRIDVLKIDTEGHDFAVLQGAEEMLATGAIRFVYVEFNDLQPKMGTTGGALCPIDGLLRRFGFQFIATYNDLIVTEGELLVVSNALFAVPPRPVHQAANAQ